MNHLVDCRRRNHKYPDTFGIPSAEEIDQLQPGDWVKLIFDDAERMWVRLVSRNGAYFEGRLDNEPVIVAGLQLGDRVCFHRRHIADVHYADSAWAQ